MMDKSPFSWEIMARYFASDCSPEEEKQIQEWRKESIDNEVSFEKLKEMWLLAGTAPEQFIPDVANDWKKVKAATVDLISKKVDEKPSGNFFYYALRIAAVLIVGFSIIFFTYYQNNRNGMSESVASERKSKIKLEDGTLVWLNKYSKLTYPEKFDGESREVFLHGEAFFEVVHNPSKPFIVHTGNTVTKVLGTSFNINGRKKDSAIVVTVRTGKVAFSSTNDLGKKVELTLGEQGVWSAAKNSLTEEKADPNTMAWHTGTLVFEKTDMSQIAKVLTEYYNQNIELENEEIGECRFTGTFNNASLEEILKTITFSLGIEYTNTGKKVVIKGQGC